MISNVFEQALERTLEHEGGEVNNPHDPGGHTYMGISRVHWPEWRGWRYIDQNAKPPLELVDKFYRINFWYRILGEDLASISPHVAMEVFDTCVNVSVYKGSLILQEALNLVNRNQDLWDDIVCDGSIAERTLEALASCNAQMKIPKLLKVLNHLQAEHYISLMRSNPDREQFSGWFERT